ncbi:hypothetical protein [Sphingobium boeckii]|uniref:Uncharacterized protein n=1 Tax=Sphingobium boeckii TaxID=1082345 RepID=A0A7W9EDB1_9SPHN|nr:hypothetical protein [Sphingobium boeckii]MBB5684932.1 hypothetical protein [Sphingobium boeckii]
MIRQSLPRTPNRLEAIENSRALDEQFLAMIVGLTSEVTVLRARLDACERLLISAGALERGAIDQFDPPGDAQVERDAQRQRILAKVFRPLREAAQGDLATKRGESA